MIMTDYNDLTMKFVQQGKIIELKGDRDGSLQLITAHQVCRLLHTNGASAFFHIQVLLQSPLQPKILTHNYKLSFTTMEPCFNSPFHYHHFVTPNMLFIFNHRLNP
jgi:hypothetical protein